MKMGETNVPRKMTRKREEKKTKERQMDLVVKNVQSKMREMPMSAEISIVASDEKKEIGWMTAKIHAKSEQFAAKHHLSTFSNVSHIDFSCKLMNLTNSSTGPASALKKMTTTMTAHIKFTICW